MGKERLDMYKNNLRMYRESRYLTQSDLCNMAAKAIEGFSITPNTIRNIEQGRVNPMARTKRALAAALGIKVEEIFPVSNSPIPVCAA